MASRFEMPRLIITGRGAYLEFDSLRELENKKSALLLSDMTRVERSVEDHVKEVLQARGIRPTEYHQQSGFVTTSDLDKVLGLARSCGAELIIAFGGRAAIQTAKILALVISKGGPIASYLEGSKEMNPGIPVIAFAMTAGSGAAISHCACLIDDKSGHRYCLHGTNMMPTAAFLEPGLTAWQSPVEVANDGVVSLGYAIEALFSKTSTPVTEACALSAITNISRWLPAAHANGGDLEAREQVLYGQQLVSMAIFNCAPTALCKVANQVEWYTRIPLGNVMAAMLPPVVEFYENIYPEKVRALGDALWAGDETAVDGRRPDSVIEYLRSILQRLEIPLNLSFLGLEEDMLEEMVDGLHCDTFPSSTPLIEDAELLIGILRKTL